MVIKWSHIDSFTTGGIADVDITQSGINDNMINLTTSGDNTT